VFAPLLAVLAAAIRLGVPDLSAPVASARSGAGIYTVAAARAC
jgi:hypothetical protein